jgi:hypothetical protein
MAGEAQSEAPRQDVSIFCAAFINDMRRMLLAPLRVTSSSLLSCPFLTMLVALTQSFGTIHPSGAALKVSENVAVDTPPLR